MTPELTVAQFKKKALRRLRGHPERWHKGSMAIDQHGYIVSARSNRAVSHCIAGLVVKWQGKFWGTPVGNAVVAAVKKRSRGRFQLVGLWQDRPWRRFDQVIALLESL